MQQTLKSYRVNVREDNADSLLSSIQVTDLTRNLQKKLFLIANHEYVDFINDKTSSSFTILRISLINLG
jgi:hypothetical protein